MGTTTADMGKGRFQGQGLLGTLGILYPGRLSGVRMESSFEILGIT